MNMSETTAKLFEALATAQGRLENASKNSANPHFRSKYADLAEILNTVRPVFSAHGLSVIQFPSFDGTYVSVETIITHKSGEWMSGVISAPVTKQDAQGVGSAVTYMRRYSLAAAAGVAQEDDDANVSIAGAPQTAPKAVNTRPNAAAVKALQACTSLEELATVWSDLAPADQKALAAVKDARKKALSGEEAA